MGKIFYILFDVDQVYNSSDINSELDYMFQGLFTSYDDAFNTFHQRLLDDEEIVDINSSNISREKAGEILDKWNWKIIEAEILSKWNWKIIETELDKWKLSY